MLLKVSVLACIVLGILLAGPSTAAPAYDAKTLVQNGDVYVVALHDTYLDAARRTAADGKKSVALFFRDRVVEIENGGELFPAHPSVYPCTNKAESSQLDDAYDEAFAVATSEAADVEPYLVARVQVAYEEWLVSMNADPSDPDAHSMQASFERSLDALTAPQILSAVTPQDGDATKASFIGLVSLRGPNDT